MNPSMENLKKLATIQKQSPAAMEAFTAFTGAIFKDGALPLKTKELVAVAVALSKQCAYCIEIHKEAAKKAGATEAELAEVGLVAAAIGAGATLTHTTHVL